jgi:phosphonate transport system permease protein
MSDILSTKDLKGQVDHLFLRKRLFSFAVPIVILGYFAYAFFAFDVPGLVDRARMDNAVILVSDSYSYKTHITRDNRSDITTAAIEGERKGAYPDGAMPPWATQTDDTTHITLKDGAYVDLLPNTAVAIYIPDYGTITARIDGGVVKSDIAEPIPDWISQSRSRLDIKAPQGRITLTRNKTEVFRYFFGWELFFFTLDSPYHGHSIIDILLGDQIDPTHSNIAGAWHDFWYNPMWAHNQVAWALFETLLMAFLGTFGAALISLPLAFLAARNFTPLLVVRAALRRVFDLFRGIDGLIWTIILARAFGPGPMTGALAILMTDTGSFGKMFSETLENVDNKQIEGLASTGAALPHRYRFGVLPQVTPVFLSQILYFFESNTRSATVIGAITGGGIGLLLTQAMITQKDWEEVTYYIILVVAMVMVMDSFSGWLRRKLIKGE